MNDQNQKIEATCAQPTEQYSASRAYTDKDLIEIAEAIPVKIDKIKGIAPQLDKAAEWFRQNKARKRLLAPKALEKRIESIAKELTKALEHLGFENVTEDPDAVVDEPGDVKLISYLEANPDHGLWPLDEGITRETEVRQSILGIDLIRRRALAAKDDCVKFQRQFVAKGNSGDIAINQWIGSMMEIYRTLTGREPGISVGPPEASNAGVPGGPLIRFLEAAGKPIGIELSPNAWAERIKAILKDLPSQEDCDPRLLPSS